MLEDSKLPSQTLEKKEINKTEAKVSKDKRQVLQGDSKCESENKKNVMPRKLDNNDWYDEDKYNEPVKTF